MTVVLDTSLVMAFMNAGDAYHRAAVRLIQEMDDDLVTSPLALAEMDRSLAAHGPKAQAALWESLEIGAYQVRWWADAVDETLAIAREHPGIGLADASLVALCRRLRTNRIATFDPHFETFDLMLLPERT